MNAEELAEWLQQNVAQLNGVIQLDAARVRIRHVFNWGGFVNHSFHVTDGTTQYHLKLTDDRDNMRKFETWIKVHPLLERRYRTPELIDRIEFRAIGFSGLVFRHVDGSTADFCNNPLVLQQLIETANRLHRDEEIRSCLEISALPKTRFDHFVETYIERFAGDLALIGARRPAFVSSAVFEWMQDQTRDLKEASNRVEAFHHPAVEPVHGDLNEGNVLVDTDGWHIVDWDDLALGDSALELAVLVWPVVYNTGIDWRKIYTRPVDAGFADRMELCLRAQLLDEVIDTVADYVTAGAVPSKQTQAKRIKKRQHEEGLKRYTMKYGGPV